MMTKSTTLSEVKNVTEIETESATMVSIGLGLLYAGSSIVIVFASLVLAGIASSRYLRVKRLYIISMNILFSLVIFYVGFFISLTNWVDKITPGREMKPSCYVGAIFLLSGWFFVLFWLTTNWVFMTFTIRHSATRHISHFFIKTAMPAYGCGLCLVFLVIALEAAQPEKSFINPCHCWFALKDEVGIIVNLVTIASTLLTLACIAVCFAKLTSRSRNSSSSAVQIQKNKQILLQHILLTTTIYISSSVHLSLWMVSANESDMLLGNAYNWLKILDGATTVTEGFLVTTFLVFPTEELRYSLDSFFTFVKCCRDDEDKPTVQTEPPSIQATPNRRRHQSNELEGSDAAEELNRTVLSPTKFQPRDLETMNLTSDDEVFLTASQITSSSIVPLKQAFNEFPVHGRFSASMRRISRKVFGSSTRNSEKSNPDSCDVVIDCSPASPSVLTLGRIPDRNSKISLRGEHERTTSF